jgi:Domain of unknown function (DUF4268)
MNQYSLGRLERVTLRDIWSSEASDFMPWLARPENLSILGETLDLDLELEAQEKAVGPFRADILCKDSGTDTWVLIENQLEKTDHNHLGQLLTYASGLQAVTIVWIAAQFIDEHRSTLDWLNRITDDSFRFFGLEVELWRIGDSPAAPRFNIVSKPNDWSRSVAQTARAIDEGDLSETRILQRANWEEFNKVPDEKGGPITGSRKPRPRCWMPYSVGRGHFGVNATMLRPKRQVRAELYIRGDDAKAYLGLLEQQKLEIETELGYPLTWEPLPNRRDCRVSVYLDNADPEDQGDWPRQHDWLSTRLNDMYRVLSPRVRVLDANDWSPEDDDHT